MARQGVHTSWWDNITRKITKKAVRRFADCFKIPLLRLGTGTIWFAKTIKGCNKATVPSIAAFFAGAQAVSIPARLFKILSLIFQGEKYINFAKLEI